jgi:ATP-binding cassette, subfamily C (CFTR/MRP), member 10
LSYWTQIHHLNATLHNNHLFLNSTLKSVDKDLKLFFIVYGSLCFGNSFFTLLRAFSFAYSCILAGRFIHRTLIDNLLTARIKYFDLTPRGRILNRVSSDMYTIDDSLPFVLNIFLACLIALVGILVLTCYSLPWFTLSLIPLSIIYYSIQNYYRWTSRELKRLTSVSLSPVYTHFNETLNGLVTIRSFREIKKFMKKHEIYLNNYIRASYVGMATSQWLNFRLQMIGVLMITIVGFTGVLQHLYGTNANASLIGLALSYILSITGLLNGLINTLTETEKEMVSVERTHQFQNIESENWQGTTKVATSWPVKPTIEFKNVCLNYQLEAPNALDNVSFKIESGEKIGNY